MIQWKRVLPGGALLLSASFGTQAETAYTFDSVTGIVHRQGATTQITGVLVNDTAPTSVTINYQNSTTSVFDRCLNFYTLMLSSPGIYRLAVATEPYTDLAGNTYTLLIRCGLERIP